MLIETVIVGIAIVITTVIFIKDRAKKDAICQPKGLIGLIKKRLAKWYLKWLGSKPRLLLNQDLSSMYPEKIGVLPSEIEETVENARTVVNQPHMADGISFMGADAQGNTLLVRLDRRTDGRAEVWLYLRTSCGQDYELPCHPDTRVFQLCSKNNTFNAGGLRIEPILAMRRWRITFNGLLRKGVRKDCVDVQHDAVNVRFNFLWVSSLRTYDFSHDINYELLSSAIAAQSWGLGFFDDFDFYDTDYYDQWGQLMGTLKIGNGDEEELLLRGPRRRLFGLLDWSTFEQYANFYIMTEDGNAIYISAENRTEGLRRNLNGYMIRSNNMLCQMDFCDFTWSRFQDMVEGSNSVVITFKAGGKSYTIEISCDKSEFVVNAGEKWSVRVRLLPVKIQMGGKSGQGILEIGLSQKNDDVLPKIFEPAPFLSEIDAGQADGSTYVVSFEDLECHQSQVVGGKGLSLALLDKMSSKNFIVPTGICITVSAFWRQIRNDQKLKEELRKLQNIAWKVDVGDLRSQCEKVVGIISNVDVDMEIKEQLEAKIQSVFGEDNQDTRLAVRSSAIGEDSEDTSAAGQNATILGVQGTDEICIALTKCWASQFSYQSVEYKRHHGQLINGGMGVVIQKMVPAEVAGIMFTADPITGNPEIVTITANYGLGESVVSAMAEPDTITVRCTLGNRLSIQDKLIGKKNLKIVMRENGGVEEKSLDEADRTQCCLSDTEIIQLAEIAKQVQLAFGTPRDIEWAISENKIYMLQSRPITSLNIETDYEVAHGLDSATPTDSEYITKGNTGEVLPGALTPLTLSTLTAIMDIALQRQLIFTTHDYTILPYNTRAMICSNNHVFISLLETLQGNLFDENSANPMVKCIEIALLGKRVLDKRFQKLSYERIGKPPRMHAFKRMAVLFNDLFFSGSFASHAQVSHDDWTMDTSKVKSSLHLYKFITENLAELFCVSRDHIATSSASIAWNLIVLTILTNNSKEEWTLDNLSDLSIVLRNCNDVISADVPTSIKEMTTIVQRDKQSAEFAQMSPKEAKQWLQSHQGESGEAYRRFLSLHAHRCVKEFDLRTVPWGDDPESIISVIQKLVSAPAANSDVKAQLSVSEAITQIRSPVSRIGRIILSFAMARSRKAVAQREQTKSIAIKVLHQFRQVYRKLATMMVHEGRIPDEDLIFFFTHHEIGQLIRTRSARLITRATRRRNMHSVLNSLQFPEISIGVVKPLKPAKRSTDNMQCDYQIKATPVSPGCIQGTARVILDVNEAKAIQPGDILVTYCTDIGWSPYFPMLGGVVTEIGGIISHGAVVAREYGLPCIVGATGAASYVQSGDTVLLDANKGTLTKIRN